LNDNTRLTVRAFKGVTYVDIRKFYVDKGGELKPTQRGISMTVPQWEEVKGKIQQVDKALEAFK
jgi:hypothetical protein